MVSVLLCTLKVTWAAKYLSLLFTDHPEYYKIHIILIRHKGKRGGVDFIMELIIMLIIYRRCAFI